MKQARERIVLYSHDTLGFGHLRRNMMLAERLKALVPSPEVLLISGSCEAGAFDLPKGVDLLTLPAYAKQSCGTYVPRRLSMELAELRDLRAEIIRAALKRIQPDLFIVDNVPLGAQGELEPALRWLARESTGRRVLGLRDVLDERRKVRIQWMRDRSIEAVNSYFTDVWVYGDPAVYDPVTEYGMGSSIRAAVRYTGYLLRPAPSERVVLDRPFVLCTVGGGRDGAALCEAFLETPLPKGWRGILVTGSQLEGTDRARIEAAQKARPDIQRRRFVPDLMPLMAGAEAVVTMGGYNSICELLQLGRPALVVPRVKPRSEQLVRAERFAALGLLDVLHPDRLSPGAIGAWLLAPLRPAAPDMLDTNGLDRMAGFAATALGLDPLSSLAA